MPSDSLRVVCFFFSKKVNHKVVFKKNKLIIKKLSYAFHTIHTTRSKTVSRYLFLEENLQVSRPSTRKKNQPRNNNKNQQKSKKVSTSILIYLPLMPFPSTKLSE